MQRFVAVMLPAAGLLGLGSACDSGGSSSAEVPATPDVASTFIYECDGNLTFTVRNGPREVELQAPVELGGGSFVLAATPAASGARYQTGDVLFWSRGDVATIEIGGRRFVDCRVR